MAKLPARSSTRALCFHTIPGGAAAKHHKIGFALSRGQRDVTRFASLPARATPPPAPRGIVGGRKAAAGGRRWRRGEGVGFAAARRSAGPDAPIRSCCCTRSCSRRSSCCSPWSRCGPGSQLGPGAVGPEVGLGGRCGACPARRERTLSRACGPAASVWVPCALDLPCLFLRLFFTPQFRKDGTA